MADIKAPDNVTPVSEKNAPPATPPAPTSPTSPPAPLPNEITQLAAPLTIAGAVYTKFKVAPLTFMSFAAIALEAVEGVQEGVTYQMLLRRARMKQQITLIDDANKTAKMDAIAIALLPIPVARQFIPLLDVGSGLPGKVITKGDGVSTSMVYQLGTPIVTGGKTVTEFEFLASNYAAVEAVMAEDSRLFQAVALLKTVAKPVGFVSMPSSIYEKVSMADGAVITNEVLDSFL
jgi:hypothetical protein